MAPMTKSEADSPPRSSSLKPCPFCANTRLEMRQYQLEGRPAYAVVCPECSSRGPGPNSEPDVAAEGWNVRLGERALN
jgi:hypothetical protein